MRAAEAMAAASSLLLLLLLPPPFFTVAEAAAVPPEDIRTPRFPRRADGRGGVGVGVGVGVVPRRRHARRIGGAGAVDDLREAVAEARRAAIRPHGTPGGIGPIDYGGRHPFEAVARPGGEEEEKEEEEEERRGGRRGASASASASAKHEPLRIRFETSALEAARDGADAARSRRIDLVEDSVLPALTAFWSEALSVVPVVGPISVPDDACWGVNGGRRGKFTADGADLVVLVSADVNRNLGCVEGNAGNMLASAYSCEFDQYDRPVVGHINFCLEDNGLDEDEEARDLVSVGAHEVGHILGMNDGLFKYFRDGETGEPLTPRPFERRTVTCIDGGVVEGFPMPSESIVQEGTTASGVRYFEITTPRVATVVQNHFNCPTAKGARLENQPTSYSCFGSHLDERIFFTDLMGPVFSDYVNALSPVTLAFFEDTGWYKANYTSAAHSTFGHGAGCDFLYEDCIVGGEVPNYSSGFFCNTPLILDDRGNLQPTESTCEPSRMEKAFCDLGDRSVFYGVNGPDIPQAFRYFPNDKNLGALNMDLADFCPIPNIGMLNRGANCLDDTNSNNFEYFGEDGRCYDVSYIDSTGAVSKSGYCFQTHCNAELNRIEVTLPDGDKIDCEYDGQVHQLDYFDLSCPRFAVVCPDLICPANCAGRGQCDWNAAGGPKCICFDPKDTSPGCYEAADDNSLLPPPLGVTISKPSPRPTPAPFGALTGSDKNGCGLDGLDVSCIDATTDGSLSFCIDQDGAKASCEFWIQDNVEGEQFCCQQCAMCSPGCDFSYSFDCGNHRDSFSGFLSGGCGECPTPSTPLSTAEPSTKPTNRPTPRPTLVPTVQPSPQPTIQLKPVQTSDLPRQPVLQPTRGTTPTPSVQTVPQPNLSIPPHLTMTPTLQNIVNTLSSPQPTVLPKDATQTSEPTTSQTIDPSGGDNTTAGSSTEKRGPIVITLGQSSSSSLLTHSASILLTSCLLVLLLP